MSDNRTRDEIRADVIVSHFLGTQIVPTIPDALRLSEQIARALTAVRREELLAAADQIDRGPTFPLPSSIFSALVRERAEYLESS